MTRPLFGPLTTTNLHRRTKQIVMKNVFLPHVMRFLTNNLIRLNMDIFVVPRKPSTGGQKMLNRFSIEMFCCRFVAEPAKCGAELTFVTTVCTLINFRYNWKLSLFGVLCVVFLPAPVPASEACVSDYLTFSPQLVDCFIAVFVRSPEKPLQAACDSRYWITKIAFAALTNRPNRSYSDKASQTLCTLENKNIFSDTVSSSFGTRAHHAGSNLIWFRFDFHFKIFQLRLNMSCRSRSASEWINAAKWDDCPLLAGHGWFVNIFRHERQQIGGWQTMAGLSQWPRWPSASLSADVRSQTIHSESLLGTHRWPMTLDVEKLRSVCTGSFLINDSPKSVRRKEDMKWMMRFEKVSLLKDEIY